MTKKHFSAIAAALLIEVLTAKDQQTRAAIVAIAKRLAEQFAAFNPNFDRNRFLRACGVVEADA